MRSIIETVRVKSKYGACPCCGDGGEVAGDSSALDWLACRTHGTKWFLGVGYSDPAICCVPEIEQCYIEVQPVYPGDKVRTLYGNPDDKLVELVFRDGTTPDLHEPLDKTISA